MTGKLDNRTGDQVPAAEAFAATPQQVDGPEVGGDAVSLPNKRAKRTVVEKPVNPQKLDSRGSQEAPGDDAYKATPQSVDGPEVDLEAVKPRG